MSSSSPPLSKEEYWRAMSEQFIEPFAPLDETSPEYTISDYGHARSIEKWSRNADPSAPSLGVMTAHFQTVSFYRHSGLIKFRYINPRTVLIQIQSLSEHDFLKRRKFDDPLPRILTYTRRLSDLDNHPNRAFTRAFDANQFQFEQIFRVTYTPKEQRNTGTCTTHRPEHFQEKHNANGIVARVCRNCGLVASEDLFQVDQSERVFEEKKASAVLASVRHVQKHGKKRAYQETQALLNTHTGDDAKRRKIDVKRMKSLRQASRLIAAVVESRSQADLMMTSKGTILTSSLGPTEKARIKAMAQRFNHLHSKTDNEMVEQAVCKELQRMKEISNPIVEVMRHALWLFDTHFASIALTLCKGVHGWKRCAFGCAVAALRAYDEKHNVPRTACHLIEDFIADGTYFYKLKKNNTVKSQNYRDILPLVEQFLPSFTLKVNIHHTILRVLDGLGLVVFTQPMNEIKSAKLAELYLYRIRARARVLSYWDTIKKSTTDMSREPIAFACAVVYESLRNSSGATRIKHCWGPAVMMHMRELEKEEAQSPSINEFMSKKSKELNALIFKSGTPDLTPDEVEMSETASKLLDELQLYPAYKAECKRLGRPLTPTDCSCAFQVKWLVRLFRVKEKRIDEIRKTIAYSRLEFVLAEEEKVLPELPVGAVAELLKKCSTGDQSDPTQTEIFSGISYWMPRIESRNGRLVPFLAS